MECKKCGQKIEDYKASIRYVKKDWKGAGKYAGSYEYDEEILIDSGVFCCDQCLIMYLEKRGDK